MQETDNPRSIRNKWLSLTNLDELNEATFVSKNLINNHLDNFLTIDGNLNLDLLNDFYSSIYVDDEMLCRDNPFLECDVLGQGKVGTVWHCDNREALIVLKTIKNVIYQRYITFRINKIPKSAIGLYSDYMDNIYMNDKEYIVPCLKMDSFGIQSIMHIILEKVLNAYNVDNYVKQYDFYICPGENSQNIGYNAMDESEGDLSKYMDRLKKISNHDEIVSRGDDLYRMLKDVMYVLYILKQKDLSYIHGDLKCKNVFYKIMPD